MNPTTTLRARAIAWRESILNEYLGKRRHPDRDVRESHAAVIEGARRELRILKALPLDVSDEAVRVAMGVA